MEKFMFSASVAREDLNPHNIKIGNEFENSILMLGTRLFTNSLSDLDCRIITGFLPLEKVRTEQSKDDVHLKKHCKGNAVVFTIPGFDEWNSRKLAEYLFFKYDDMHIILDYKKKTIYVGVKFRSNILYERLENGLLKKL